MKKMTTGLSSITLAFVSAIFTFCPAGAETLAPGHEVGTVTNYGDGMQIMDYADNSGFEAVGGGARFVYDVKSKSITFIQDGLTLKFSADGQIDPQSADAFSQLASR
jgi:hypothetical protein